MYFTTAILAFAATAIAAPSLSSRDYQCQFGQYACSEDGLTIKQCDITGTWVVSILSPLIRSLQTPHANYISRRSALAARTRSASTTTSTTCHTAPAPPASARKHSRRSAPVDTPSAPTPEPTPARPTAPASTSALHRISLCSTGGAPRELTALPFLLLEEFPSVSTTRG